MAWVALVIVLALFECLLFSIRVGKARVKYGVVAPATTGNEIFERHFRVHHNTIELLVLFVPSIWLFAQLISPFWAAGIGAVYLVGRPLYAAAYVRDPKSRSLGFALSILPILALMIGVLVGAIRGIVVTGGVG